MVMIPPHQQHFVAAANQTTIAVIGYDCKDVQYWEIALFFFHTCVEYDRIHM